MGRRPSHSKVRDFSSKSFKHPSKEHYIAHQYRKTGKDWDMFKDKSEQRKSWI